MRKLLSILAAATLVATASAPVVGCSIGKSTNESIPATLEEQNFRALAWISENQDKSVGDYLRQNGVTNSSDLLYSNGLTDDNKIMTSDQARHSIIGSFGASKWTFINLLNAKFNLGMKVNVTTTKPSADYKEPVKAKDLLQYVKPEVTNFDKLNNLKLAPYTNDKGKKVDAVNITTQGEGNPPEVGNVDSIKTFDEIINLGSQAQDKEWWKSQEAFLKDNTKWKDYQLTKYTNFADEENRNFTFTQIIRLTNTVALNNYLFGAKDDKGKYTGGALKTLADLYTKYFGENGDPDFTLDDLMNLVFSKLNIFDAQNQEYSVSVDLDCNYLRNQARDAIDDIEALMSTYINDGNQESLANALGKDIVNADGIFFKNVTVDSTGNDLIVTGNNLKNLKLDQPGLWQVTGDQVENVSANNDGSITIELDKPVKATDAEQDITISYNDPDNVDLKIEPIVLKIKAKSDQIVSGNNIRLDKVDWSNFARMPRDKADASYFKGDSFLDDAAKYINNQIAEQAAGTTDAIQRVAGSSLALDSTASIAGDKLDASKDKIVLGAKKPSDDSDKKNLADDDDKSTVTGIAKLSFDNNNLNNKYGFKDKKFDFAGENTKDSKLKSSDFINNNMSGLTNKTQEEYGDTHYLDLENSNYVDSSSSYKAQNKLIDPKDVDSTIATISNNYKSVIYDANAAKLVVANNETINIVLTDQNYNSKTISFDIDKAKLNK